MDIFWNYTLQGNWPQMSRPFSFPFRSSVFCFSFVRGNAKYTRGPNPDRIFMYGIVWYSNDKQIFFSVEQANQKHFSNHVISERATFKF